MSAKLNIATAAELATKEAYINTHLVDAYIQENEDGEGNLTYTLSFIQKDEEDPDLSNVVELDYARPSDIPNKGYKQIIFAVSQVFDTLTVIRVVEDEGLEDVVFEQIETNAGEFSVKSPTVDLSDAFLSVGAIQGGVETNKSGVGMDTELQVFTKQIMSSGDGVAATFDNANNLLLNTLVTVIIPDPVV